MEASLGVRGGDCTGTAQILSRDKTRFAGVLRMVSPAGGIQLRIQIPLRAQKVAYRFHCLLSCVRIKADGGTASYTSVLPGESRSGVEIDDIAGLLFFFATVGGNDRIR